MVGQQNAERRHGCIWLEIVVHCFDLNPALAAAGKRTDGNSSLGIQRETQDRFIIGSLGMNLL